MQLSLSGIVSSCRERFSSRDRKSGYMKKNFNEDILYTDRVGLAIRQADVRIREEYSKTAIARDGGVTWPRQSSTFAEWEQEGEEGQQFMLTRTLSVEEEMANLQYRGPRMDTIDEEESSDISSSSRPPRRASSTAVTDESSLLTPGILPSGASASFFASSGVSSVRSSLLSDSSALSQYTDSSISDDCSNVGSDLSITSMSTNSGGTGLIISPGRLSKPVGFVWDYAGKRRFQEASALHSILSTHFSNLLPLHQPPQLQQPQLSITTPPQTPLSARSSSSSFPAGDEDDVMSTITVEGGTAPARELVDQFAFIADAGVMKRKKPLTKGKLSTRSIEGTYWGESEAWREAESENMTAVCMEEWSRAGRRGRIETGVTFRVAMNSGVPVDVLEWLKGIAAVMESFAKGLKGELECEDALWSMVVEMNQKKIREDIIKRFYTPASRPVSNGPGRNNENCIDVIVSKISPVLQQAQVELGHASPVHVLEGTQSLAYIHQLCERIVEQGHRGDVQLWKDLLVQCYHLRRSRGFRAFLFGFLNGYDLFRTIQKLGRYRLATQALVDAVRAHPHQFRNVEVDAIPALSFYDLNSSIYPDADLRGYLRGILNTWRITALSKENTEKIRTAFRERCADLPIVHAEMQLVKYYEENPMAHPPTVIGCSKKPCQLCVRFLDLHGQFTVEKCHARISHRWSMPNINCHSPEGMTNINGILQTMTAKMEDTLRELLGSNSEKRREVSSAPMGLYKKSFSKSILDLPASASWDSGFGETMSSRTGSAGEGGRQKATACVEAPIEICDPITPPPSRSLHDLLPEIPDVPPQLRRRRRSPISLKDEYKCPNGSQEELQPALPSPVPIRAKSAPLPFSPPPIVHRPSSPTLGWSTRFPARASEPVEIVRDALDILEMPQLDTPTDEVEADDEAVFGRQVYHGEQQDSGIFGTSSEQTQSPMGLSRKDGGTMFPVLDGPSPFFAQPFPESRSRRSSRSRKLPEESLIQITDTFPEHSNVGSPDSFYTHSLVDASPSGPVDIQIIDQSSSTFNAGSSHRLPTPPEVDITHLELNDNDEPFRATFKEMSQKSPRPVPPKDMPHILISSPTARLQRQKESTYIPPPSTLLSTSTPPSTPSSSNSSLVSQNVRQSPPPALSRRQSRSRHPLAPSASSSSLTSQNVIAISRENSTRTFSSIPSYCSTVSSAFENAHNRPPTPPQYADSAVEQSDDSSGYTYWTSDISSTIQSKSSSEASAGPISNATVVPLRRKAPMLMRKSALGIIEQEVSRVIRESGALRRTNRNVGTHNASDGDVTACNKDRFQTHSSTLDSDFFPPHHHHRHTPPSNIQKAPGIKSFLLRATRRSTDCPNQDGSSDNIKQNQNKKKGSQQSIPDVSWISVDIGEELLRGRNKFEVTAQLLAPENQQSSSSRRGSKSVGMILRQEYKKDQELLILDMEFGAAVLRLKIFW